MIGLSTTARLSSIIALEVDMLKLFDITCRSPEVLRILVRTGVIDRLLLSEVYAVSRAMRSEHQVMDWLNCSGYRYIDFRETLPKRDEGVRWLGR